MLDRLRAHRASLLEIAGLACITLGAALVYFPAGLIVAGLGAVFVAQGVE